MKNCTAIAALFLCATLGALVRAVAFAPLVAAVLFAVPVDNTRADSGHSGMYPLHQAAENGNLPEVNHLLSVHGINVDVKNDSGNTPLHRAADDGHVHVVSVLLAAGAEVDARNDDGETPMIEGASGGYVSVVPVLLAAGADVNAKDNNGKTSLHRIADEDGRIPVISVLLAAGADVNAKDNSDRAPLHYAIYGIGARAPVVSILLAAGADVNAKDNDGKTPLHRAIDFGSSSVIPVLIAAGGHWGEACAAPFVVNPAGASTPCICGAGTVEINGECEPLENCAAPSTRNESTNQCECRPPNLGTGGNCQAPSVESCGGLTPPKFYDSTAEECAEFKGCLSGATLNRGENICECAPPSVLDGTELGCEFTLESCAAENLHYNGADCESLANCAAPSTRNESTNQCECHSPNLGTGGDCQAPSVESCGGLTPPKFYDSTAGECAEFKSCLSGATLNRGKNICECASPSVLDGTGFGCEFTLESCAAANLYYNGANCEPLADCAAPSTRNESTNQCECHSPNLGTGGDCQAPSVESCGGLTPPKFYDSTAGECAEFKSCLSGATLNRGKNICECASPSVLDGTGFGCEFTLESCAAANLYYNGANCEPLADCAAPSTRNQSTNQCECHSPNLGTGGDCQTPSAKSCAEFYNPPRFYDASAGECGDRLYPCHDSATRKADNSGCECPPNSYAHGDPSGGSHSHIPDTAICHADHAPIFHDLNGWLDSIRADNPTLILHFVSQHGESPNQLVYAVNNSASRAVKILIERGANVDQQDFRGETPLHLAARRSDSSENAALVSFLLDKGADPNIFNNNRWRPLDLADGRDGYPRRRKIMSALIAGGANWSDECVGGKVPNEFTPPKCKCPARLSIDNNGLCECPAHSHSQVNGRCLPQGSAEVDAEIAKMQVELARLRAALVSLNARLSLSAEMPREMVEDIAEQARETAAEIDWRRANFVALGRRAEAGEAPPPVALSDTAAECRMRGGEMQIDSGSGTRICLGLDRSGTFCLVDSGDAFPCRGLFKHVRRCNDVYHRPALNAFICGARCGADETARGNGCE